MGLAKSVRHYFFCVFLVLLGMAGESSAKFVAVLETSIDQKDLLTLSERQYLTNVLREQAVRELPAEQNFTIMTRENINMMLPPGKSLEECEGSCLAETGKNISADYVAQARITKVGETLALSADIYETAGNKLVASFNGRGKNVDDLEKIINEKSPEFFKKVKGSSGGWGGAAGFGDFATAGDFSIEAKKSFIVEVNSQPEGAALSIDGRPIPKCTSTPCKVQVEEGEHRFVLVKDRYEDGEVLMVVAKNGDVVSVELQPAFGVLELEPQLLPGVGDENGFRMFIDDNAARVGKNELDPGIHQVRVYHPCYDPVEFKVGIEKQKKETYREPLVRGKAGLKLTTEWRGEVQAVPVYIDGVDAGSTPFYGEVPMCARITVGESGAMEIVHVPLKWHETVEYTHALKNAPAAVAMKEESERVEEQKKAEAEADKKFREEEARRKAIEGYAALDCEVDGNCEKPEHGESIPTNIEDDGGIAWIPLGISAAVAVTGTVLAIVGEVNASSARDRVPTNADEYKKDKDDIHKWQTMRTAGLITAIVGAVGIGVSFAF